MSDPTVVREPARAAGAPVDLLRVASGGAVAASDTVGVEEPLEIHLNGWRWLVTMRTPGDDADLIVGLLAAEGAIGDAAEVAQILFTRHPEEPDLANVADARLLHPLGDLQARLARNQALTSSSCGLCGSSAVEAIRRRAGTVAPGPAVTPAVLAGLPATLAAAQPAFRATGGLHAAALFDAGGRLLAAREDIGRHNATDKVLGWRLRAGRPAEAAVLLVSGRASFEIVQKALAAGVAIVAAVSAPSSLAVTLARETGMTLVAFLRGGGFNVYAGAERLRDTPGDGETRGTGGARVPDAPAAGDARGAGTGGPRRGDPPDGDATLAGAALELIPRAMRRMLDAAALKISLADWQALTLGERTRLVVHVADGRTDDFRRDLHAYVSARTGRAPRPLAPTTP